MQVSVIKIDKDAALVEWHEGKMPCRAIIPAKSVHENGEVEEEVLSQGAPYGIDYESALTINVTVSDIAMRLRSAGIWTKSDAMRNPGKVVSALQSAYKIDLSAILTLEE